MSAEDKLAGAVKAKWHSKDKEVSTGAWKAQK